jgi:uncharacterized protein
VHAFNYSWASSKLESFDCGPQKGKGVRAVEAIRKGEVLSFFGGNVITSEEFESLPYALQIYGYQVDDDLYLALPSMDGISTSEYYNHSCNPNAGFRDSITLVAMRDIRPGEEVAFDYCMCTTTEDRPIACVCGDSGCRGVIRNTDWMQPELQRKYKGYFVPFIEIKLSK